ncbi:MAG: hypothetical protein RIA69_12995 [Cyclobacteriaceae bacterium]
MKTRNLVLILLISIWGCNEIEQCQLDRNSEFLVGAFYNIKDSVARDTLIFNAVVPSTQPLNFYDTIFFGAFFPLNPTDTMISYTFFTDSMDYELSLSYDVLYYLFSPDCDPSIRYFDLKVVDTNFDSVAVVGDVLDLQIPINLEVYF